MLASACSLVSARGLGELVPRAHGQAVVAAEHAVADGLAELGWDVALVLDRQVGDAAARIELVGRRERLVGQTSRQRWQVPQ